MAANERPYMIPHMLAIHTKLPSPMVPKLFAEIAHLTSKGQKSIQVKTVFFLVDPYINEHS